MACGVCGSGEATRPLCSACTGKLERYLAETDALCEELETTITRQARTRSVGNASGERPIPYHVGASEAKADLRRELKTWVAWVLGQLHDEGVYAKPPVPATPESLASCLLVWLDWISRRDEAPDLFHAVQNAVRECWRAVDAPGEMLTLGQCGGLVEGVECTEPLRAPAEHRTTRCRTCGAEWDVAERRDHMLATAWDYPVTATEASRMIPDLTPDQIRKWRDRGHVTEWPGKLYTLAHLHRLHRLRQTGGKLSHIDKETA